MPPGVFFSFNFYSGLSIPMGSTQCRFVGEGKEEGRKKEWNVKERKGKVRNGKQMGGEGKKDERMGRKGRGPKQYKALRAQAAATFQEA